MIKSNLKHILEYNVPDLVKNHVRRKILKPQLNNRYLFEPEMKIIRSIVPHSTPFFDIGANEGRYSILVEDIVTPQQLYCFEPLPRLSQRLKRILRESKVYMLALSDREGTQLIKIPKIRGIQFETRATLEHHIHELEENDSIELEIHTTTLDHFVEKNALDALGFLKIDVEGHEGAVIKGGMKTLVHYQPLLLIEIEQRHHQYPISHIFSMIESLGYLGFYLDPSVPAMKPIEEFSVVAKQDITNLKSFNYINNFLFAPTRKAHSVLEMIAKQLSSL